LIPFSQPALRCDANHRIGKMPYDGWVNFLGDGSKMYDWNIFPYFRDQVYIKGGGKIVKNLEATAGCFLVFESGTVLCWSIDDGESTQSRFK
jgi:hypothetical protein